MQKILPLYEIEMELGRMVCRQLTSGKNIDQARENEPDRQKRQPEKNSNDRSEYNTLNGQIKGR